MAAAEEGRGDVTWRAPPSPLILSLQKEGEEVIEGKSYQMIALIHTVSF
jgi:hypothetical protein